MKLSLSAAACPASCPAKSPWNLASDRLFHTVKWGSRGLGTGTRRIQETCFGHVTAFILVYLSNETSTRIQALVVEPQEVVLGQTESADRRLRVYTTMGPVRQLY